MRIDVHTHVFTLYSIMSREAIRVITERLGKYVSPMVSEAIGQVLYDQLDKPEYMDEHRLLQKLLAKLLGDTSFSDVATSLFANSRIETQITGDLDALAAGAISDIITRVLDGVDGGGTAGKVLDVIETLRQSMQPTITDVSGDLLKHMDDDGVIVALMMDIFKGPESERDRRRYIGQIDGHAEAALQRPGRVLPFFGVHPERPGHLEQLKKAIETKGFVGVKLYPSLGYSVDSATMRLVYGYCLEKDLPVLLHCGHGGFYRTEDQIELCNPAQWEDVLRDFDGLRVCFAHFGGWQALGKRNCLGENWPPPEVPNAPDSANWGKQIYDYMVQYPNVYTDLAKHVSMFTVEADKDMYFDTMRELIANPQIGKRILFGTDAWLLRLDMPFAEYWEMWETASGAAWDDITVDAPRAFLGFEGAGPDDWRDNLTRFVSYMAANRDHVGQAPAAWLAEAVAGPFTVDRDHPSWDRNKMAVLDTYQFLAEQMTQSQKDNGFVANSELTLNELRYFDSGDPNFMGRCRDLARRLVDFAEQGMGYRDGHDFESAADLFIAAFKRGDRRFCEVALMLNTVIAYPGLIS